MSVRNWQSTPTIVVEDVDDKQIRLECQSPPSQHDCDLRNNNNAHSPLSLSKCGVIMPQVDAYVTPLSLCHPSTPISPVTPSMSITRPISLPLKEKIMVVSGGSIPPCLATSGSESSFTSVDIGGPHHPAAKSNFTDNDSSWNSWSDVSQHATSTGCFDLKSGLMCVTRAIAGSISDPRDKCDHHRVDISENPLELHQVKPLRTDKKRMSLCSMIGIFFICIAIIGLVAIGIAMYIEFVTKPLWAAQSKQPILNETTICDFLLDSCDNSTASTVPESSIIDHNHTDLSSQSGRIEAQFSSNFTNQLTSKLPMA